MPLFPFVFEIYDIARRIGYRSLISCFEKASKREFWNVYYENQADKWYKDSAAAVLSTTLSNVRAITSSLYISNKIILE